MVYIITNLNLFTGHKGLKFPLVKSKRIHIHKVNTYRAQLTN